MNPDLEHLIVLQSHDLELRKLRAELADAPVRVAAAQTARAKAEVTLTAAKNSIAKELVLRNSQETEVAGHHSKIARLRKQMESATSAAQISALEHEITFAEQSISQLEDQELASLERSDSFEAEKTRLAGLLQSTTAALEAARARAAEVTSHNSAQITAIEAERSALRPLISENVLSNYDRIAKAKGTAVSEARDHKCSACQMMVRPQRWNDLSGRDPDSEFANTIFNCETCGRMLFYDPRRDAPVSSPAIDKLHRAESP